ncbi:MAG: ferritin [Anaerolineae bacterium]|nr:ferritin [Thermoflexales bacterium]MDW8408620.1 ferritin [Anaerolineae bacterium]
MINKKVEQAINEQIKHELYSSYLYLAMANYFESIHLPGFAHWMKVQSEEERGHAMKFIEHLNDRGGRVVLQALDQPPADFGEPLKAFEQVQAHEQKVTALIHALYDIAVQESDKPSQTLLQWFIDEQVEEEKNADLIVNQLKMIAGHPSGLLMLDRALAARGGNEED